MLCGKLERHGKGVCAARKFNGADAFERARMKIPVRFSVESAVSVRFESVLTGAGINRTAYRTVLHIEAVLFTAERDGAEPVTV